MKEIAEIERQFSIPQYWDDEKVSQKLSQKLHTHKKKIKVIDNLQQEIDNYTILLDFYEQGEGSVEEISTIHKSILKQLDTYTIQQMFRKDEDVHGAIIEIHAGAGGVDSQDWASILERMYVMWGQKQDYRVKKVHEVLGLQVGIKSSTLEIEGEYAYGYLKSEVGVHRLVRISPFNATGKRHTSFASIFVYPMIDEQIEVNIEEKDLEYDTFRSGGAGGQNVNKLETAVRVKHLPSGLTATCQEERFQIQNKAKALRILKAKLYQKALEEANQKKMDLNSQKKKIDFGSQIRSYTLDPFQLIKDHRTGIQKSDIANVLDGNLVDFMKAYLVAT